ncbi:hypothetical protein ACVW1A_002356 [Bradyrhizobium sp. LB1.3]
MGRSDRTSVFIPIQTLPCAYAYSDLPTTKGSGPCVTQLFEQLADRLGFYRLRDLLDEQLPTQGVYFFFDDLEKTRFSSKIPRLVRIGTHGVSLGSTATLRNRLRTHLGTKAGRGNHRSSVFRLHVGRALIARDGLDAEFPHWAKGQAAPKSITDGESALEAKVSEYIGQLRVLFVPVIDASGTSSMRATIERQFIALFTENFCTVDQSSSNWLGQYSDKPSIRRSGLWNVRDVGIRYDLKFMPLFESVLEKLFRNLGHVK